MKTLKPRVRSINTSPVKTLTTRSSRTTGGALQSRRFTMWKANPCCRKCGRLVDYPRGFELDHIIPLWEGGRDTEDNCQILCVYIDHDGNKAGCHANKTAGEAVERG